MCSLLVGSGFSHLRQRAQKSSRTFLAVHVLTWYYPLFKNITCVFLIRGINFSVLMGKSRNALREMNIEGTILSNKRLSGGRVATRPTSEATVKPQPAFREWTCQELKTRKLTWPLWFLMPGVAPPRAVAATEVAAKVYFTFEVLRTLFSCSKVQESAKGAGGKGARVINCHNFFFTPDGETRRIDHTTTEGTAERKMRQFATPAPFTPAPFRPFWKMRLFRLKTCTPLKGTPWSTAWIIIARK